MIIRSSVPWGTSSLSTRSPLGCQDEIMVGQRTLRMSRRERRAFGYNSLVPTGARFVFEPFELDPARRRLAASGAPVAISERQLDVLLLLVTRAGQIVSKDDLLQAGWKDVAVGDNSLEQVISSLRRLLGTHPSG